MKPVYPQSEDRLETPVPLAMALHPVYADLILQEQMRRLHNTRARQRAARHHRAGAR